MLTEERLEVFHFDRYQFAVGARIVVVSRDEFWCATSDFLEKDALTGLIFTFLCFFSQDCELVVIK